MTPEEINETYNVLASQAGDYANALMERNAQAQASISPLTEQIMGGSRTAGLGNYTYNRLIRPSVDAMRDSMIVSGLTTALNKQISDSLKAAQENYENAYKSYARSHATRSSGGRSSGSGSGGSGSGGTGTKTPETDDKKPIAPDAGNITVGDTKEQETGFKQVTSSPTIIKDSYTVTQKDGKKLVVRRADNIDDMLWFKMYERARKEAEAAGEKFTGGGAK